MDDQLNKSNAEDDEVIEDVEVHPCDSKNEQSSIEMYKHTMVRKFKYQPHESIKLVVRHAFQTLDFFRQVLVDYCV